MKAFCKDDLGYFFRVKIYDLLMTIW
uniref:Uncharacterized protein n=1 Tax=Arundo donax TaxID=35708 RepID=A0A0A9HW98_ARUDO